jgi:uncharacterized protein (DUF1778 family)
MAARPRKTKEHPITIRFRSKTEVEMIKRAARRADRSFNNYVVNVVAEAAGKQLASALSVIADAQTI